MRRHLFALAVVGAFGSLLASDASACCHKRQACAPAPCAAPVACAAPAPVCAPAPCAAPRKHCFSGFRRHGGGLCHRRQTCAPVAYAAPCNTYAAPMAYPTAQASGQY